jgi:hypothetical protein
MLSLDNTTASELPAAEWVGLLYLVAGPRCGSCSAASGRGASAIANPLQRFGQWLRPAAFIPLGVYLLQRCGRLARDR